MTIKFIILFWHIFLDNHLWVQTVFGYYKISNVTTTIYLSCKLCFSIDFVIHISHKWKCERWMTSWDWRQGFLLGTCSELFQIVPIFEVIKQWCFHNIIPHTPPSQHQSIILWNITVKWLATLHLTIEGILWNILDVL